jgi:hypothetical protein
MAGWAALLDAEIDRQRATVLKRPEPIPSGLKKLVEHDLRHSVGEDPDGHRVVCVAPKDLSRNVLLAIEQLHAKAIADDVGGCLQLPGWLHWCRKVACGTSRRALIPVLTGSIAFVKRRLEALGGSF